MKTVDYKSCLVFKTEDLATKPTKPECFSELSTLITNRGSFMKQIVSSNGLMRCLVLQLRHLDYQATEAKNRYALIPQTAYNIYTQNFVPDLFFLQ